MNKLLNKSLKIFTLYSLIVLAASIPVYYYLVDSIWLEELDEHNEIIAKRTEFEFDRLNMNKTDLKQSLELWNKIQPGTSIISIQENQIKPDSIFTIVKQRDFVAEYTIDRFRCLSKTIFIDGKPYHFTVETNVEETEEIVIAIAIVTIIFFLILVIGFLLLNKRLSTRLWRPFRNTLSKLKTFTLHGESVIRFENSSTLEFEELNTALSKLIEQNIKAYKSQKEFTENASHELQTPLAIIKGKLDLLLQKDILTHRQYLIIEEINLAITRISRINKNLLLLAKIDNHHFKDVETINLSELSVECWNLLEEHADNKELDVEVMNIDGLVYVNGNRTLTEILLVNLLINAIQHTNHKGILKILIAKRGISVLNSGIFSLDEDRVFRRFAKHANDSSGSGLGLSIVKEISNLHRWETSYAFTDQTHHFSIQF